MFICTNVVMSIYNPPPPPRPLVIVRCANGLPGRLREDVLVEVLHDLHHQPEAVHEGVDGDAEHAVGRGPVVDVQQHLLLRVGCGRVFR